MAALFVLALVLIAWQMPRTRPLLAPPYVSVLETGEQVFPLAVPPDAPLTVPTDPSERLAFLREHAVEGFEDFPAASCEAFVRMSAHHWLRLPVSRESPSPRLPKADMEWLARGETEVFCSP